MLRLAARPTPRHRGVPDRRPRLRAALVAATVMLTPVTVASSAYALDGPVAGDDEISVRDTAPRSSTARIPAADYLANDSVDPTALPVTVTVLDFVRVPAAPGPDPLSVDVDPATNDLLVTWPEGAFGPSETFEDVAFSLFIDYRITDTFDQTSDARIFFERRPPARLPSVCDAQVNDASLSDVVGGAVTTVTPESCWQVHFASGGQGTDQVIEEVVEAPTKGTLSIQRGYEPVEPAGGYTFVDGWTEPITDTWTWRACFADAQGTCTDVVRTTYTYRVREPAPPEYRVTADGTLAFADTSASSIVVTEAELRALTPVDVSQESGPPASQPPTVDLADYDLVEVVATPGKRQAVDVEQLDADSWRLTLRPDALGEYPRPWENARDWQYGLTLRYVDAAGNPAPIRSAATDEEGAATLTAGVRRVADVTPPDLGDDEAWAAFGQTVSLPFEDNNTSGDAEPIAQGDGSGIVRLLRGFGAGWWVTADGVRRLTLDDVLITPPTDAGEVFGTHELVAAQGPSRQRLEFTAGDQPGDHVMTATFCLAWPTPAPDRLCDTETLTVHVRPPGNAVDDLANADPGAPVTVPVLGNDVFTDRPGDPATVTLVDVPADVTAVLGPDRTVSVTAPEARRGEVVELTYRLTDFTGVDEAQVRVLVSDPGGPTPDPTPTPDPEPTPDPTPTPEPEPTPEPTPDPTPTPEPEPTPEPTPDPTPEPEQPVAPDAVDDEVEIGTSRERFVRVLRNDVWAGAPEVELLGRSPEGLTARVAGRTVVVEAAPRLAGEVVTVRYRLTDESGLSDTATVTVTIRPEVPIIVTGAERALPAASAAALGEVTSPGPWVRGAGLALLLAGLVIGAVSMRRGVTS